MGNALRSWGHLSKCWWNGLSGGEPCLNSSRDAGLGEKLNSQEYLERENHVHSQSSNPFGGELLAIEVVDGCNTER